MCESEQRQADAQDVIVTPAMIEAGVTALLREADDLGMGYIPSPGMLVRKVLECSLGPSHEAAAQDAAQVGEGDQNIHLIVGGGRSFSPVLSGTLVLMGQQ